MVGSGVSVPEVAARPATSAPVTHTITASAGSGVTIDPTGAQSVVHGGSLAFTLTASSGYDAYVSIDGGAYTKATSHTFTNVTADHTIAAQGYLISSARTAVGAVSQVEPDEVLALHAGALEAGDLLVVQTKVNTADVFTTDVLVDGNPATRILLLACEVNAVVEMWAYRASGAGSGEISVAWVSEGDPISTGRCWASKFTNIASDTPNSTPQSASGTTGTNYATTGQTTTVKNIQVGVVSKYSGSTGTWATGWTNGQGASNSWSEGYKLDQGPAAGCQTSKTGGTSARWGALWAAFPMRT